MAAAMARTRDSASAVRVANATPQIPHTLAFNLRSREECGACANEMLSQMEARNLEALIGIPAEERAQQHEEQRERGGGDQDKEGFALEEQAPIKSFIPSGIEIFEGAAQTKALHGEAREADVREA